MGAAEPHTPNPAIDLTPIGDPQRLQALEATGLLDSPDEESFDRITRLAERILNVPVAMVSLVDRDRQFFKSQVGLSGSWAADRQSPLTHSFCQYAVASGSRLVVEDAREHNLVRGNPAIAEQDVVAYAGEPLSTAEGHVLGTLCIIDHERRVWEPWELEVLSELSALAITEIDYRLRTRALQGIEALAQALEGPVKELDDAVSSMANVANRSEDPRVERLSSLTRTRLRAVQAATRELVETLPSRRRALAPRLATVNLGERLLRAAQAASVSADHSSVRVEILDRPLPVRCDAHALDAALGSLLAGAMHHAGTAPVEAALHREGAAARLVVRGFGPMPVAELARIVSSFDAAIHPSQVGVPGREASITTANRVTTAESGPIWGRTGPQGSELVISLALADIPADTGGRSREHIEEAT